jgi:hypothetical protein
MIHETDFSLRWIYAQFIAVDANFKLKLKNRHIKDPELGSGWFYFVENTAYVHHVANNTHNIEVGCVPSSREASLMPVSGHKLWDRIPCSEPSELAWRQGLYC